MKDLLKNIVKTNEYKVFTQFKLPSNFIIDENHQNLKNLLINLDIDQDTKFFISKTLVIDSINVIDIQGTRIIEFENDLYEFTNKGLNNSIELNFN